MPVTVRGCSVDVKILVLKHEVNIFDSMSLNTTSMYVCIHNCESCHTYE